MDIKPPSQEEFEALSAQLAYRFPEKAAITVQGDGGAPVRLPVVLGNPSGACVLPAGVRAKPAWAKTVAITLAVAPDATSVADELAADCVLWPDAATFAGWVERWPGLPVALLTTSRQKFGGTLEAFDEPAEGEEPPKAIAEVLAERPRAVWRKLKLRGVDIALALEAPASTPWRFFQDAMRKKDADHWKLVSELAGACVKVCVAEGFASFAELVQRYPGAALVVAAIVAGLAGVSADVELGNW